MNIKFIGRLLAPYLAIGIFWCVFSNGWLTIIAYHIQSLVWGRRNLGELRLPVNRTSMLFAFPMIFAGPLIYFLLPHITQVELINWLGDYHLSGVALLIMIPYLGMLHPFLEQMHWAELRCAHPLSHLMFAGYHMLVLYELLPLLWLGVSFVVLAAASIVWHYMTLSSRSLFPAVLSHVAADLSIIIAVYLLV